MISWDNYPAKPGTLTPFGTIERSSLTAYLIDGEWIPFHKIHGERPVAEPLVVIL